MRNELTKEYTIINQVDPGVMCTLYPMEMPGMPSLPGYWEHHLSVFGNMEIDKDRLLEEGAVDNVRYDHAGKMLYVKSAVMCFGDDGMENPMDVWMPYVLAVIENGELSYRQCMKTREFTERMIGWIADELKKFENGESYQKDLLLQPDSEHKDDEQNGKLLYDLSQEVLEMYGDELDSREPDDESEGVSINEARQQWIKADWDSPLGEFIAKHFKAEMTSGAA